VTEYDEATAGRYVVSPYSAVVDVDGAYALYEGWSMNVLYVDEGALRSFRCCERDPAASARMPRGLLDVLTSRGFLVEEGSRLDPHDRLGPSDTSPRITVLQLLLTDACDLDCRYCQIEKNRPARRPLFMSRALLETAVDVFLRHASDAGVEEPVIVFFGGEPLLNRDLVVEGSRLARDAARRIGAPRPKLVLYTNALRVDESLAAFLAREGVNVLVSLDGDRDAHDAMRVSRDGAGSFDRSLEGYRLLERAGCSLGISCAVGKHNLDRLGDLARFFAADLRPRSIGMNMPHRLLNGANPAMVPMEAYVEGLVAAFEATRSAGVFVEQAYRRIEPFAAAKPRFKDCSACGAKMSVSPDGRVSPCSTYFYCSDDLPVMTPSYDPRSCSVIRRWAGRASATLQTCSACPYFSLCGAGCVYDAYVLHGDIEHVDERYCVFTKRMTAWMLRDLWRRVDRTRREEAAGCWWLEPSAGERLEILESLTRAGTS